MRENPTVAPVQAFAFGKLTEDEATTLAGLALDDQRVFDELFEAIEQRELLADFAFRQRLIRALESSSDRPRLLTWVTAHPGWATFGGVLTAAALVFLLFIPLHRPGDQPDGSLPATISTNPSQGLDAYFRLRVHPSTKVVFAVDRQPSSYHMGEIVHATIHVGQPAAVFVLCQRPGGETRMVFPSGLSDSPDLNAGEISIAFDPVPPNITLERRESVFVRYIAVPRGTDIRFQTIDWKALPFWSIGETSYDVRP